MSGRTISVKEAIAALETASGGKAAELEKVDFSGSCPAIDKMDASVSSLKACNSEVLDRPRAEVEKIDARHLALSSNNIEKMANLSGLPNLEILSLGRNLLKRFDALDGVSATLRELWVSYNQIDKVAGLEKLAHLQVLYMSNNKISSWREVDALSALKTLEEVVLIGNPIYNEYKDKVPDYRMEVLKRMPFLKKLDGMPFELEEREALKL